jgi:hypothetical protein
MAGMLSANVGAMRRLNEANVEAVALNTFVGNFRAVVMAHKEKRNKICMIIFCLSGGIYTQSYLGTITIGTKQISHKLSATVHYSCSDVRPQRGGYRNTIHT